MSKTDSQLKLDIEQELQMDPRVADARIGVSVDAGAVSLFGAVDTNAQKWAAEDATKRVHGVRAIAQNLTVKLRSAHERTDSELAAAVHHTLSWDVCVPEAVSATVHYGAVTLTGAVAWNYERRAAEQALRHLKGIVAIHNAITIVPLTTPVEVTHQVSAALQRGGLDAPVSIHVACIGGEVTLSGEASSWQTIIDAENAAWAVSGVTQVFDHIKLST